MAPVESNFELAKDKCAETWAVLYKFLRECEYFTVLFFQCFWYLLCKQTLLQISTYDSILRLVCPMCRGINLGDS